MNKSVAVMDALGRRTGPRRQYTLAEKRRLVEETLEPGASVSVIAQRHGINTNLIFGWRRLHQRGLLTDAPVSGATLLPVKVNTPTLLPTKRAGALKGKEQVGPRLPGSIEIVLAAGHRVSCTGRIDRTTLRTVFDLLARR